MIENSHTIETIAADFEKWLSKVEQAIRSEQLRVADLTSQLNEAHAALAGERARSLVLAQDLQSLVAAVSAALKLVSALEAKAGQTFETGETLRMALNTLERHQA